MAPVQLSFLINAHQNANQKPIGSAPAYRAQCTLPPQPVYQTFLFDFSRVWFQDYSVVAVRYKGRHFLTVRMRTYSLVPKPNTTIIGLGTRLVHEQNPELTMRTAGMVSSRSRGPGL